MQTCLDRYRSKLSIIFTFLMSHTINFQQAVQELHEMFPKHSVAQIERVLRENRMIIDTAVTKLLSLKPETVAPQSRPNPSAQQKVQEPKHIFPKDFLRFPNDVEWVLVSTDTGLTGQSPLQSTDDVAFTGTSGLPSNPDDLPKTPLTDFTGTKPSSGWSKFKARFSGSGFETL